MKIYSKTLSIVVIIVVSLIFILDEARAMLLSKRFSQAYEPCSTSISKRFLGTTSIKSRARPLNFIELNSPEDLHSSWNCIRHSMEHKGWCILQMKDSNKETLIETSKFFGLRQNNNSADKEGITNVVSAVSNDNPTQVVSRTLFSPHTDGAYLNGMAFYKNTMHRVIPPKFIFLQCVEPAEEGGESVLIDGRELLIDLIKYSPHLLPSLFSRSMHFHHNEYIALDLPVLSAISPFSYGIRWSYDKELYFPNNVKDAIDTLNYKYIENPEYHAIQSLLHGQILIIDNKRVLHGRSGYSGTRFYRRLWIYDELNSEALLNATPVTTAFYKTHRSIKDGLLNFQNFCPVESEYSYTDLRLPYGINLPTEIEKKLKEYLK